MPMNGYTLIAIVAVISSVAVRILADDATLATAMLGLAGTIAGRGGAKGGKDA